MRVLVCGGRDYARLDNISRSDPSWKTKEAEYYVVQGVLTDLAMKHSKFFNQHDNWLPTDFTIIAGGATGADKAASSWAAVNWTRYEEFKPDWKKYGSKAGPLRNQRMLDEGRPDLVIAFPGGKGTADMVARAEKAGVRVVRYG